MGVFISDLCSQPLHPFAAEHAGHTYYNKGYAEQLAHVEGHAGLEVHLVGLGVLDEEAEGEDEREHKAEEETTADGFGGVHGS